MQPLLRDVEWEPCSLEPIRNPELEAFAKRSFGTVPPGLRYMAHCPWAARAMIRLSFDQALLVHLDFELAELVAMVVNQQNSCRYCYGFSRALLRIFGKSEAEVLEIERQLTERTDDPRTSAVLNFARRLSRADPLVVRDDGKDLLDVGFTTDEALEIAYVVAFTEFANRMATLTAVPPYPTETLADHWWMRLLRPLVARSIRRHARRGNPESASSKYEGPYAYVVAAFSGSPIAGAIADVLEDAWSDPELTPRCKGLLFAVVAKALDCDLAGGAAREALGREGFEGSELDRALEHLTSPLFDPIEQVLVPFARETIWYQPAAAQRRAKSLLDRVTPAQLVAAIGTVALANALCRLGAAVADA